MLLMVLKEGSSKAEIFHQGFDSRRGFQRRPFIKACRSTFASLLINRDEDTAPPFQALTFTEAKTASDQREQALLSSQNLLAAQPMTALNQSEQISSSTPHTALSRLTAIAQDKGATTEKWTTHVSRALLKARGIADFASTEKPAWWPEWTPKATKQNQSPVPEVFQSPSKISVVFKRKVLLPLLFEWALEVANTEIAIANLQNIALSASVEVMLEILDPKGDVRKTLQEKAKKAKAEKKAAAAKRRSEAAAPAVSAVSSSEDNCDQTQGSSSQLAASV